MCRYTAVAAAAAACCRCSSLLCAGWQKLLLWFTASDPCVSSSSFKHDLVSTYPLAVPSHTQRRFLNLKKNMNVRFSQNKIRHRNRQNSIGVDRALEITGLKFALREKDWSFWKTGQDRWWSQLFYYCFLLTVWIMENLSSSVFLSVKLHRKDLERGQTWGELRVSLLSETVWLLFCYSECFFALI